MKYHCFTESGSRYTIRIDDEGNRWLEGEAEARDHPEGGSTRGMVAGVEFPCVEVRPWPPKLGFPLAIHYRPEDLDEGTNCREKKTSRVLHIRTGKDDEE